MGVVLERSLRDPWFGLLSRIKEYRVTFIRVYGYTVPIPRHLVVEKMIVFDPRDSLKWGLGRLLQGIYVNDEAYAWITVFRSYFEGSR
jgi:hypothetical protein